MIRDVDSIPFIEVRGRSPPRTTVVRDVGDAVRTQRSGGQPEYEPIRAACNRLAQLSTCTETLRKWRETCAQHLYRHSLREVLYCVCVSLVLFHMSSFLSRCKMRIIAVQTQVIKKYKKFKKW